MKKITLLGFSMILISMGLHAQKVNNIKTDLFSAFIRTGVIKYERAFTEDISAQLGFFYTGYTPGDGDGTLNGIGITPEFRFFLSETPAPNGTYLAPNFRYMKLSVNDPLVPEDDASLTSLSFGFNLGKQVLLKDIIVIDAWVGPTYAFRSVDDASGAVNTGSLPEIDGFGIRLGVAIGIAF